MKPLRYPVTANGLCALITTHDINLASKYADLLVLMKDGRIFAAGEPFRILNEENIKNVYGIKVEIFKGSSVFVFPF